MTNHRTLRLGEQFRREISEILSRKVRDPRAGHVLVTEVRVSPDLWVAKVFFRLLDSDRKLEDVQEGLRAAAPFIRKELGGSLRIRRVPELRFVYDRTLDSAIRIERVLREVLPGDPGEEGPRGGDLSSDDEDRGREDPKEGE
jgi:ribosome-binding factor A